MEVFRSRYVHDLDLCLSSGDTNLGVTSILCTHSLLTQPLYTPSIYFSDTWYPTQYGTAPDIHCGLVDEFSRKQDITFQVISPFTPALAALRLQGSSYGVLCMDTKRKDSRNRVLFCVLGQDSSVGHAFRPETGNLTCSSVSSSV